MVKRGSFTTFNTVRKRKIRKTWSMTKTKSSEIFGVKMEIFPEKSHSVPRKIVPPPNSAPGLRHCERGATNRHTAENATSDDGGDTIKDTLFHRNRDKESTKPLDKV